MLSLSANKLMSLLDIQTDSTFTPTKNSGTKRGDIQNTPKNTNEVQMNTGKFNLKSSDLRSPQNNFSNLFSNTGEDPGLTFREDEVKNASNRNAEEYHV